MPHVTDYIQWRGDIPFENDPLNEVDNLIFCLLSYVELDGAVPSTSDRCVTLREAAKEYFFTHDPKDERPLGLIVPREIVALFRQMADAPRYRDLQLCGYVNEICEKKQVQFSALTIRLPDDTWFAAVRGTDDTIVGWREDFNLSWMDEVPAQRLTAEYLDNLPLTKNSRLYVGGHSKGGNLAVWGAVHASPATRDRIVRVYSNDGPGFSEKMLESEAYRTLADRIDSLVPQSSLVGMLLSHDECDVIRSSQLGIFQHNGLSWEVMGGSFVRAHRLSGRGVRNDSVIRARIDSMTMEERKKFTELFFGILESTGARTLTELNAGSIRNVIIMLRTVSDMDRETKEMALYLIGKLFDIRPLTVPRKQKKRGAVRFEFGLTVGRRKSAPMQEQKP